MQMYQIILLLSLPYFFCVWGCVGVCLWRGCVGVLCVCKYVICISQNVVDLIVVFPLYHVPITQV